MANPLGKQKGLVNIEMTGDWAKSEKWLRNFDGNLKKITLLILKRESMILRSMIVQGLKDQNPGGKQILPISAWTRALRKFNKFSGRKSLIVSGQLRNSIIDKVYPAQQTAFVGILYQTQRKKEEGKKGVAPKMVNIAKVQEFGSKPFLIKATPKMRRFLAMVARSSNIIKYSSGRKGSAFYVVTIPARPFMKPVFEEWKKDKIGMQARIQKIIKKKFGTN